MYSVLQNCFHLFIYKKNQYVLQYKCTCTHACKHAIISLPKINFTESAGSHGSQV